MTVGELLKSSLRLIGAIATGETPSNDEMKDALSALNLMLDAWSIKRGMIYVTTLENFNLVAGTASYTIGSSGTFDTTKPVKVLSAYTRDSDGNDSPLEVYTERERYNAHTDKTLSRRPDELFYQPSHALAYLYAYPVPDEAYTLYIESLKPLSSLSGYTTEISLPDGYENALVYNLAVRLAPEFGTTASPEVVAMAVDSMNDLRIINSPEVTAKLDIPVVGVSMNIETGQ